LRGDKKKLTIWEEPKKGEGIKGRRAGKGGGKSQRKPPRGWITARGKRSGITETRQALVKREKGRTNKWGRHQEYKRTFS